MVVPGVVLLFAGAITAGFAFVVWLLLNNSRTAGV
jgi:hypothetical protein